MIDDLAKQAGIPLDSYETVRVGMNVTAAILRGDIDTGVGFTNFQRIELEELSAEDAGMLRIDELNDLGCCCFCSVQYVANGDYFEKNPEKISGFMRAMRRATDFTIEHPDVRHPAPPLPPAHTYTAHVACACMCSPMRFIWLHLLNRRRGRS